MTNSRTGLAAPSQSVVPGAGCGATPSPSYEAVLGFLARDDERIVILTAENHAAIRSLPAQLGHRFVDVGICEQTMIGVAAGLALRGRIPVVHALATFLTLRAFEFIRTDVGIAGLPVKLVGGVPGLLSEANGPTHQALDDLAVMRAIPGMSIVCPADEEDLCAALPAILAAPGPVYVRHNPRRSTPRSRRPFVLGQAEPIHTAGDAPYDIAVLALGFLVPEAVEAARLLGEDGLRVAVSNMRTLAPIDEAAVVMAARNARLVVTIEDHFLVGGLYQTVSEVFVRHGLAGAPVLPIGFNARFFPPGLLAEVMEHEGLTGRGLAERIFAGWSRRGVDGSAAAFVATPTPREPHPVVGRNVFGGGGDSLE